MSFLSVKLIDQKESTFISFKKILTLPAVWWQRSIMRNQLSKLPDYRLKDMGISQEEVCVEVNKAFWEK